MRFHVFRCKIDRDVFVVTDEAHLGLLDDPNVTETPGDELEKVGVFGEMGAERAAFDETLAKHAIARKGYYRFHAKTYDPVATPPLPPPGW